MKGGTMSRVSKYPVSPLVQEEMFRQFWRSISHLRSVEDVSSFFSDLLTETEEVMLAKRLAVAILVLNGKKAVDIVTALHVTYTTVGTVVSWVKNAKPHTRKVLKRMIEEREWQMLIDAVEGVLDALPPRYGTNWHRVGKERYERRLEREARSRLK